MTHFQLCTFGSLGVSSI